MSDTEKAADTGAETAIETSTETAVDMENVNAGPSGAEQITEHFHLKHDDNAQEKEQSFLADADQIIDVLKFCREEIGFRVLLDITAVDYMAYPNYRGERFATIYVVKNLETCERLRFKVSIDEDDCEVPSAHEIFRNANWLEREAYDQYGINFIGHPNQKRLLNHHEFIGHPLRKDYPAQKRQKLSVNDPMIDDLKAELKNRGIQLLDESALEKEAGAAS